FGLAENGAAGGFGRLSQLDQGRMADGVNYAVTDLHARFRMGMGTKDPSGPPIERQAWGRRVVRGARAEAGGVKSAAMAAADNGYTGPAPVARAFSARSLQLPGYSERSSKPYRRI